MPTDLPVAGHISNNARTDGEVKSDLDDLIEVIRQTHGNGQATETVTVSSGTATVSGTPTQIFINGEGSTTDDLDILTGGDWHDDALVSIQKATSMGLSTLTVKHAAGADKFSLANLADFDLKAQRDTLLLKYNGTSWDEVARFYYDTLSQTTAERKIEFLGLGDVATLDIGSGNGIDADTLDGVEGSGYLLVGGTAADATLLGAVAAANYVRNDVTSRQTLTGKLRAANSAVEVINDVGDDESRVECWHDDGVSPVRVGEMTYDEVSETLTFAIYDATGSTVQTAVTLDRNGVAELTTGSELKVGGVTLHTSAPGAPANGDIYPSGSDVIIYSGGSARNLSSL